MSVNDWIAENIPDMAGKLILITGANSGIGFEAAKILASKNGEVILACRNQQKGEEALANILESNHNAQVSCMQVDLADLKSVQRFARDFLAKYESLDVLINNAGLMAPPYQKTKDGFEIQFGTNHLGHFALTGQLIGALLKSHGSRIVNVSSNAHKMGKIRFHDLNWEKKYSRWPAYGQSKIANLYFTYELDKRLKELGKSTLAVAVHPGFSNTNLAYAGYNSEGNSLKSFAIKTTSAIFSQDSMMGSLPSVYAAAALDVKGSDYYGPSGWMEMKGIPKKTRSNKLSHDADVAKRLWDVSVEMTGVDFSQLMPASQKASATAS